MRSGLALRTARPCSGGATFLKPPAVSALMFAALWYGGEASLAAALDWPLSSRSIILWVARDIMLPALWIAAVCGDGFAWRGNEMTVGGPRRETGELQLAEE